MAFRFNPRPFRWLALAAMVAVLGATLSGLLERTRERGKTRRSPDPIAPQVDQQTEAFSLSKSSGDHTLYTVHSRQVTHFRDKVVLHGVSILLYGKQGERRDVIEAEECEYDPAAKSLVIPGEVTMKLGIPPADTGAAPNEVTDTEPDSVTIITTGLAFDQDTGVVSTEQEVEFQFEQGEGTAQGAVYEPESQQLTLRSAVHFVLSEAGSQGKRASGASSVQVRAGSLRFRRGDSVVYLTGGTELSSGAQTLRAGEGEILLDERRQARRVRLEGGVHGSDRSEGAAEVRARRGVLELSDNGRLNMLHLEDAVEWSASSSGGSGDTQPERQGRANRADLFFSSATGVLERIVALQGVRMVLRDSPHSPQRAARSPRPKGQPVSAGMQTLSAERVEMRMALDGKAPESLSASSQATLDFAPFNREDPQWQVTAREFQMSFDSAGNLTRFEADQTVQAVAQQETGPAGRKVSTSDHLSASVDALTRSLTRIEQWGRYQYQDAEKKARAERAEYSTASDVVVLKDHATVWNGSGKISANSITLRNAVDEIEAEGNLSTLFQSETSTPGASGKVAEVGEIQQRTSAVADRMKYNARTGKAQYDGRVRLWQGANLLQAERVELDRPGRQMLAQGNVYSVFPQQGSTDTRDPIEIRSARMTYSEADRRAVYQGQTRMRSASSVVNSDQLEVFFPPSGRGSSAATPTHIERAVASGGVVVLESGRKATADRAEYLPGQSLVHLWGKPATVSDPVRGATKGVRLTYQIADDRIFVEGEPGLPAETRRQVER